MTPRRMKTIIWLSTEGLTGREIDLQNLSLENFLIAESSFFFFFSLLLPEALNNSNIMSGVANTYMQNRESPHLGK